MIRLTIAWSFVTSDWDSDLNREKYTNSNTTSLEFHFPIPSPGVTFHVSSGTNTEVISPLLLPMHSDAR